MNEVQMFAMFAWIERENDEMNEVQMFASCD
jgi:hypothetical protein